MSESATQREIMLAVSKAGARIFRHNVGEGWMGDAEVEHNANGISVWIPHARPLHAGLTVGGSDLIGWTADGRFLALEIKTKTGRLSREQATFIEAVRKAGGVAACVRSVDEALEALKP